MTVDPPSGPRLAALQHLRIEQSLGPTLANTTARLRRLPRGRQYIKAVARFSYAVWHLTQQYALLPSCHPLPPPRVTRRIRPHFFGRHRSINGLFCHLGTAKTFRQREKFLVDRSENLHSIMHTPQSSAKLGKSPSFRSRCLVAPVSRTSFDDCGPAPTTQSEGTHTCSSALGGASADMTSRCTRGRLHRQWQG